MKNIHYPTLIFLILLFLTESVTAQSGNTAGREVAGGYRNFKLGMELEQVKKLLKEDVYFHYRGDPDVSFLPVTEEPLIECEGNSYIERAYFQFHEKKLFIITIVLNTEKLDYYTLYTTLTSKYGKPAYLNPDMVVWEFNEVRLSLERPLSIKYIATEVFNRLKAENKGETDYAALSKKEFLNQF